MATRRNLLLLVLVVSPTLLAPKGCHFGASEVSLGTNVVAPGDTDAGEAGSEGDASSGGALSQGGASALPEAGTGGSGVSGGRPAAGAGGRGSPPLASGGTSHGGAGGSAGGGGLAGAVGSGGAGGLGGALGYGGAGGLGGAGGYGGAGGLGGAGGYGGAGGGPGGYAGAGGLPPVGDMLPYWVCSLPVEAANCEATQSGLYFAFNRDSMECEQVTANCSDPFSNLFATEEECVETCATYPDVSPVGTLVEFTTEGDPAACMLPPLAPSCAEGSGKRYYFDPRNRNCFEQECLPENPNTFRTPEECADACLPSIGDPVEDATAVVEASSCAGFGEQISDSTSGGTFAIDGNVLSREDYFGCGCPSRAEFVLVYEPTIPLGFRLCRDQFASICAQACPDTLRWDVTTAFARAGTTEFVFVD